MRLLLHSLLWAVLSLLATLSLVLLILFSQHYRLISVHQPAYGQRPGDAILRRPNGQTSQVIPKAGRILDGLHLPIVLLVLVIAPASLVIIGQLRHLWRCYARPGYSARLKL